VHVISRLIPSQRIELLSNIRRHVKPLNGRVCLNLGELGSDLRELMLHAVAMCALRVEFALRPRSRYR
jgi:hypothetical protein